MESHHQSSAILPRYDGTTLGYHNTMRLKEFIHTIIHDMVFHGMTYKYNVMILHHRNIITLCHSLGAYWICAGRVLDMRLTCFEHVVGYKGEILEARVFLMLPKERCSETLRWEACSPPDPFAPWA